MCGIAGFFNPRKSMGPEGMHTLKEMAKIVAHRGPDGEGFHLEGGCGFAFRRLAIIDIESGMQPMVSPSGDRVLVFNGEIYNFLRLRKELEIAGYPFRTRCDAEVILAGYEIWGKAMIRRLRGMFAFAIFDRAKNELFLARDHTGIKPLYYAIRDDTLVFASEIKAILQYPGIRAQVNLSRLPQHMSFLWVPSPETLFLGIHMLEPAHTLVFGVDGLKKERYWNPDLLTQDAFTWEEEWIDRIENELQAVVREQLMSDVPLGALFSGGVDSSLIVALINRVDAKPVTTYTTGFESADMDKDIIGSDLHYARMAARHLRVEYHELILHTDVVELLPKIVWHMDEPVADPAALTTYLICQAVKPRCTVMLTGVGGDEVFGGYPRYLATLLAEQYKKVPRVIRSLLMEPAIRLLPGGRVRWLRNAKKFVKSAGLPFKERYCGYLTYYSADELRRLLKIPFSSEETFSVHDEVFREYGGNDRLQAMMNLDLKTFLPNLNLLYTDKMSSAAGVEVRVPFLDHLLIEQASRIPSKFKIHDLTQKYMLKKTAAHLVPSDIVWRRKAGFGAPIGAWLKGKAREMMLDLLSEERIKQRGYFHYPAIRQIVDDHLQGREYNANQLWQLMVLEVWHQRFIDS